MFIKLFQEEMLAAGLAAKAFNKPSNAGISGEKITLNNTNKSTQMSYFCLKSLRLAFGHFPGREADCDEHDSKANSQ